MLTVKHIDWRGAEQIVPAFKVELRPANCGPGKIAPPGKPDDIRLERVLAFTDDGYVAGEWYDGVVYVMNAEGRTVSRYDLGAPIAEGEVPAVAKQPQAA